MYEISPDYVKEYIQEQINKEGYGEGFQKQFENMYRAYSDAVFDLLERYEKELPKELYDKAWNIFRDYKMEDSIREVMWEISRELGEEDDE